MILEFNYYLEFVFWDFQIEFGLKSKLSYHHSMTKIITWDIETQNGLGNWRDFTGVNISVLGAIDEKNNEYIFWENELANFIDIILEADIIVGFNTLGFDVPVLQNYTEKNLKKLPHYDIMDEFKKIAGHRINLESLAQATLGLGKSGTGIDALRYWSEGKKEELSQYCLDDVRITKQIMDLVLAEKPIKYIDISSTREILLPKPIINSNNQSTNQSSLF